MKRILVGLQILSKYNPDGDASAEHDVIYASDVKPEKMSEEDLKILDENGWYFDESDLECWYKFT